MAALGEHRTGQQSTKASKKAPAEMAAATATTTEAVGADAASRDQAHTTAFAEHDGRYPGEGQRMAALQPLGPKRQKLAGRQAPVSKGSAAAARTAHVVTYHPGKGVDDFVRQVAVATPMQLVQIERHGVAGRFLKDLSKRMDLPAVRVFAMLGVPKATVEKKSSAGEVVAGSGGQAAIGMAKLIAKAQEIVGNSTAKEAQGFDAAKWLGQWLDRPQPALGGRKPAELIDTPTGVEVVARLLGAIESGAYQ